MAKRFTDTEKWDDPFFLDMPHDMKLVYFYMLDKCDAVGVWKVNKRMVEFCVCKIDWDMFISYMGKRLYMISDEKWWLTKFCDFQYGVLKEDSNSKPVISHINLLKKHSLYKGYTKGIDTLKEKEQDKVKVKEEVKDSLKEYGFSDKVVFCIGEYKGHIAQLGKSHKKTMLAWDIFYKKVKKFVDDIGEEKTIECIGNAIEGNWKTLFPLKSAGFQKETTAEKQKRTQFTVEDNYEDLIFQGATK